MKAIARAPPRRGNRRRSSGGAVMAPLGPAFMPRSGRQVRHMSQARSESPTSVGAGSAGSTSWGNRTACEVRGAGAVARPAANDEAAIGAASGCHLADVVGGQVGRGVRGAAFPSWAPVADDGAVVGDGLTSAPAFGRVVVQVRPTCNLAPFVVTLAVVAAWSATHRSRAAEAGAEQGTGHRRLRRLRSRSLRWQSG